MTIPLPPLPRPISASEMYYPTEVRAMQREAIRIALQAAAQVCRDFHATDSLSNYGLVLARMIDALEVEC